MLIKRWPQLRRILIIKWLDNTYCGYQSASSHSYSNHHPRSSRTKWQGWRLCLGSATRTSNYQVGLDYVYCWVLVCQQQRPTLIPRYGTVVWVISQLSGGRLTTLDHCYRGKETFCSHWNRHLLCIWICLHCIKCFCQNYHLWTCRIPIHALVIPQSITSDEETLFIPK